MNSKKSDNFCDQLNETIQNSILPLASSTAINDKFKKFDFYPKSCHVYKYPNVLDPIIPFFKVLFNKVFYYFSSSKIQFTILMMVIFYKTCPYLKTRMTTL